LWKIIMSCLNEPLYILTYDESNPQIIKTGYNNAIEYKNKFSKQHKYDYYYLQFSNDKSFTVFPLNEILNEDQLQQIRDRKVFLVLDNSLEYFLTTVDMIYNEIVIKQSIPAEQIMFLTAVPNILPYVKNIAAKLKLPEIKVEYFSIFEDVGKDAIRQTENLETLPKKKKYQKKFINLNRRWRIHRPLMVTLLKDKNLLDQGT